MTARRAPFACLVLIALVLVLVLATTSRTVHAQDANTLTSMEKTDGWRLLFDGRTTKGWRGAFTDAFPAKDWQVRDGMLIVAGSGGAEAASGGDIMTVDEYSNFELLVDFKLSPGANSGIKYFVTLATSQAVGSAIGLEYQLLDDALHPDAKLGINGNRTLASLYDLIPAPSRKVVKPMGEWNQARIVVNGKHVEHWLNGAKVIDYERGDAAFRALRAMSKFRDRPTFGEAAAGHILLQEHGSEVFFRNIKLRVLTP